MNDTVLDIKKIDKSFYGVKVLDDISFSISKGEVHALLGENGAGKSTLVKIISGVYKRDSGLIRLNGRNCSFKSPAEAYSNGIGIIYQETSLINEFTVIENVFLGVEKRRFRCFLSNNQMIKNYKLFCDRIGLYLNPDTVVKELSIAEKKIVEIMKCLIRDSKIVIMDEPTDALTEKESRSIFSVIKELRKRGVSVIYITHYLSEVFCLADRATVLKDGKCAGTVSISDVNEQKLIKMITDKEFKTTLKTACKLNNNIQEVLRTENISYKNKIINVSFNLYKGEILGVTGLVGAGKTELAMLLFGAIKRDKGDVYINNKQVGISNPCSGKKSGIGLLTEDRNSFGLIHNMSIVENYTLPSLSNHVFGGLISTNSELKTFNKAVKKIKFKSASPDQAIETLSGGNKQKLIIGKWLEAKPEILILDEPTRGVDLRTKSQLYSIIRELSESGKSIIFISTDIPELVGISHRIMVMKKGRVQEICSRGVTEKDIYNKIFIGDSYAGF